MATLPKPASTTEASPILAVRLEPISVRLRPDRRSVVSREAARHRLLNGFEEIPGTVLTLAQATRLCQMPAPTCARILAGLLQDRTFRMTGRCYRLRSDAA